MLEILKLYRALVVALLELKSLKNKNYQKAISTCMEILKSEIDKFMDWFDDNLGKDFIDKFYLKAFNQNQYESQSGSSYDSMRAHCRRACKKYDKIIGKKL